MTTKPKRKTARIKKNVELTIDSKGNIRSENRRQRLLNRIDNMTNDEWDSLSEEQQKRFNNAIYPGKSPHLEKVQVAHARSPRQIARARARDRDRAKRIKEQSVGMAPSVPNSAEVLAIESRLAKARGEGYAAGFFAGREGPRLPSSTSEVNLHGYDASTGLLNCTYEFFGKKKKARVIATNEQGQQFTWKKKKGKFGWHKLHGGTSSTQ